MPRVLVVVLRFIHRSSTFPQQRTMNVARDAAACWLQPALASGTLVPRLSWPRRLVGHTAPIPRPGFQVGAVTMAGWRSGATLARTAPAPLPSGTPRLGPFLWSHRKAADVGTPAQYQVSF
jgi:hypothetical protein